VHKNISRKLLIVNIAVLVILFTVYIFGYYILNYPLKFNFFQVIKECEIYYLCIALLFLALVSWMISTLKIKNLNSINKFLLIYTILCGLLLGYFLHVAVDSYISTRKAIKEIENKYIQQAKEDIKKDNVTYRFSGGFSIPEYDAETLKKIDSIRKKFGISYESAGCTVDAIDIEGQKKYEETVKPYLEKRNGKGWEERMDKEIEKVKKVKISDLGDR
jgi:hypothetical protein